MNQKYLIETIANKTNLPTAVIEKVIKAQAEAITEELKQPGGEITLHHQIGKLKIALTAGRQGRNPATGMPITIAAKRKVVFKVAKGLKEAVNVGWGDVRNPNT
ncbi:MAG: HU family DNA-binding protein [Methylovulum sp.]|nr:HU family DNA-binding protein [Methylovulum sp.]